MLIEFAGCTSSGKSLLAAGVTERFRAKGFALRNYGTTSSSLFVTGRNITAATNALPRLLFRGGAGLAHFRSTVASIRKRNLGAFWTCTRIAAAARLTAAHVNNTSRPSKAIINITDEGILTTISLALTGMDSPDRAEIAEFSQRSFIPDLIVFVDAPLADLMLRTRLRPDAPREVSRSDAEDLGTWLRSSKHAYQAVLKCDQFKNHLIRVWNPQARPEVVKANIDAFSNTLEQIIASWQPCSFPP